MKYYDLIRPVKNTAIIHYELKDAHMGTPLLDLPPISCYNLRKIRGGSTCKTQENFLPKKCTA